jgi:hypothetical protein
MALSPNYGWAEPDNSSLVKNGAQDIRALGDAIDTSVWNVGYGQAGKNKIINGNFSVWARGTTFNSYANGAYSADRFFTLYNGSSSTRNLTQQTFTPGTAPVAGYENQFFARYDQTVAGTSATFNTYGQRIEDVRTFAGQTITVSFYAKAASATTFGIGLQQNFGSGGSGSVTQEFTSAFSVTTSWARYSYTFNVASISGKTIGTSSYLWSYVTMPLNATFTLDTWGWQLEYGSKATPFQTASGGSPQAELAMCQRYYWRGNTNATAYATYGNGYAYSATAANIFVLNPIQMRTAPTLLEYSNVIILDSGFAGAGTQTLTIAGVQNSAIGFIITTTDATGLTAHRPAFLRNNNNTAGYIGVGAEL